MTKRRKWDGKKSNDEFPQPLTQEVIDAVLRVTETDNPLQFTLTLGHFSTAIGTIRLGENESMADAFARCVCRATVHSLPTQAMCARVLSQLDVGLVLPCALVAYLRELEARTPVDDLAAIELVVAVLRGLVYCGFTLSCKSSSGRIDTLMSFAAGVRAFSGDPGILNYLAPR